MLSDGTELLGSDLAVKLRARGFTGTICLLSGISADDAMELAEVSGIDISAEKGGNVQTLAERLIQHLAS